MIDRQRDHRVLVCDTCDDDFDMVHEDDFADMINRAKVQGWTVKPDGDGGWEHYCRRCKPSGALERARKKFCG